MLTYTFKIKTSSKLIQKIENHLNITRLVYNLSKDVREYAYSKGIKLTKFDLIKQLPELKSEFKWISDAHSQTLQGVIERLDKGYDKFFSDLKKNNKTSKPKWAKKKNWKSVEFKSSAVKVKDQHIEISKIGKIKFFKSREIQGKLKLARIIKECDGYYIQIVTDHIRPKGDNQAVVALDMGVKFFTVTSDGEFIDNPKHLFKYLSKLRIENRKLSRCKKGSSNFYKQVRVLQKLYLKISRTRKDFLHKISSELSKKYSDIVIENLDILKMSRSDSKLSKHILDCAWGNFFEMLEYKTNVHRINPAYTSQTCSKCGYTDSQNRKTQSHFECVKCNHTENADLQAAKNILELGHQLMEANVEH